jgi:putative ABC transport system substrate-binding protein
MDRRGFITFLGGTVFAASFEAAAQTSKIHRLGTLSIGGPRDATIGRDGYLISGLTKRGHALGKDLVYEVRATTGDPAQVLKAMQELEEFKADAVVAVGYPAAVAAKASGIPTVLASGIGDPVATRLVDSLARPGGNVTGISDDAAALSTKRLELLKEMSPRIGRVAMLWNKDDLGMSLRYEASAKAARELGVSVYPLGVREPNDFDEAFAAMNREPPDAILMVSDTLTILNRKRVFAFATERGLPAIYEADYMARDGGLMAYGADLREVFDRTAGLVDRIFKGVKPADLPVEQPTRYLFVINMKAAKAINLKVPGTLLAFADEVIE